MAQSKEIVHLQRQILDLQEQILALVGRLAELEDLIRSGSKVEHSHP